MCFLCWLKRKTTLQLHMHSTSTLVVDMYIKKVFMKKAGKMQYIHLNCVVRCNTCVFQLLHHLTGEWISLRSLSVCHMLFFSPLYKSR